MAEHSVEFQGESDVQDEEEDFLRPEVIYEQDVSEQLVEFNNDSNGLTELGPLVEYVYDEVQIGQDYLKTEMDIDEKYFPDEDQDNKGVIQPMMPFFLSSSPVYIMNEDDEVKPDFPDYVILPLPESGKDVKVNLDPNYYMIHDYPSLPIPAVPFVNNVNENYFHHEDLKQEPPLPFELDFENYEYYYIEQTYLPGIFANQSQLPDNSQLPLPGHIDSNSNFNEVNEYPPLHLSELQIPDLGFLEEVVETYICDGDREDKHLHSFELDFENVFYGNKYFSGACPNLSQGPVDSLEPGPDRMSLRRWFEMDSENLFDDSQLTLPDPLGDGNPNTNFIEKLEVPPWLLSELQMPELKSVEEYVETSICDGNKYCHNLSPNISQLKFPEFLEDGSPPWLLSQLEMPELGFIEEVVESYICDGDMEDKSLIPFKMDSENVHDNSQLQFPDSSEDCNPIKNFSNLNCKNENPSLPLSELGFVGEVVETSVYDKDKKNKLLHPFELDFKNLFNTNFSGENESPQDNCPNISQHCFPDNSQLPLFHRVERVPSNFNDMNEYPPLPLSELQIPELVFVKEVAENYIHHENTKPTNLVPFELDFENLFDDSQLSLPDPLEDGNPNTNFIEKLEVPPWLLSELQMPELGFVEVVENYTHNENKYLQEFLPYQTQETIILQIENEGEEQAFPKRPPKPPQKPISDEVRASSLASLLCRSKSSTSRDTYTCEACEYSYGCLNCLKSHYETMHLGNTVIMHYKCKYATNVSKGLYCPVCELTFETRSDTMDHYITHAVACDICGSGFDRQMYLTEHLRKSHSKGTFNMFYDCELCKASYQYHNSLSKHYQNYHKMILCVDCDSKFENTLELLEHEKTHRQKIDIQPYACNKCDKAFAEISEIAVHIRQDHHKRKVEQETIYLFGDIKASNPPQMRRLKKKLKI